MAIFKGAGVAIVTPMYDNEEVNYDKLEELINWQIDEGTDSIIICGTTGACDLVVLDEVLGLVNQQIIAEEDLLELAAAIPEDMVVICTGRKVPDAIKECADELYQVTLEK